MALKDTSLSFLGKQCFTEKPVLLVKCSSPSETWQDWDEWWCVCSGLNWVHLSMKPAGAVTLGQLTGPSYDCDNSRGYFSSLWFADFLILFLLFPFKKIIISLMLLHVDKWPFISIQFISFLFYKSCFLVWIRVLAIGLDLKGFLLFLPLKILYFCILHLSSRSLLY